MEARRKPTGARQREGALRRSQSRCGRRDREVFAGPAAYYRAVVRGDERIGEPDARRVGAQPHLELQQQQAGQRGERIVYRDVFELARIDRGETHVELADVADVTAQLGNLQQTVGVRGGAAGQVCVHCRGQGPGVGRVDVEHDRGAIERELIVRRIPRSLCRADAWCAHPGYIERQVAKRMVIGRIFRVTARHRGIGKRPRGADGAERRGRIGTTDGGECAARKRGRYRLRAGDRLLAWCWEATKKTLRQAYSGRKVDLNTRTGWL